MIEYSVLGPVILSRGGTALPVPTRMVRRLLALLLAQAGTPVSADLLIECLWPGPAPASARRTLQVYVSRLRSLQLPDMSITSEAGGYALRPLPDELDSAVFSRLVAQSQQAGARGEVTAAIAAVRDALGLWRGPAYEDFRDLGPVTAEADRLEALRLSAVEYSVDLLLDVGRAGDALSGLRPMIAQHPYRERLRGQHMLALYRAGQRAEALDSYREFYDLLVTELGVEPGPQVAELHQGILDGDPVLATAPHAVAAAERTPPRGGGAPAQLPRDLFGFVGRRAETAALRDILGRSRRGAAGLVIAVISGMPGVGKTALATHVAHRMPEAFPDGQLYANLRGYDASPPRRAAEVLQAFLVALGEPATDLPADLEDLAALYRSRLYGRRMLVLLDNARDAAHVRPLLPGTSGCAVLVTSRSGLADLVVSDGAVLWPLDVLDSDSARELLTSRLGTPPPPAEVSEVSTLCGRLPLALAITAARAASIPLAAVIAGLRAADARLSALELGPGASSMRAVFTWSYDKLSGDAARLFRALGWHPAGELDAYSAASVSGLPLAEATRLLSELAEARLAEDEGGGRFAVHDLLHVYAREMAGQAGGDPAGTEARARLDDHLLHTAYQAARLTQPHRSMVTLDPLTAGAVPVPLAGRAEAGQWLGRQHGRLLDTLQEAHEGGRFTFVWRLAWCLTEYLHRYGHSHDWLEVQRLALLAAEQIGDRLSIATANRNLGRALMHLNRYDQARELLRRALDMATASQLAKARAITLMALTELSELTHNPAAGLAYASAALDAYEEAGDAVGRIYAVHSLAYQYALTGQLDQALRCNCEAMEEFRRRGDEVGLAHAYDARGAVYHAAGEYRASIQWYDQARTAMRDLGHRAEEATVLDSLGDVRRAAGQDVAAVTAWRQCLAIRQSLSDVNAVAVRRKIEAAFRR
ncbi:MAG TPA: BTAD domain-containing putative transcriptional regulator [Streptosporangiaceae bacterium]